MSSRAIGFTRCGSLLAAVALTIGCSSTVPSAASRCEEVGGLWERIDDGDDEEAELTIECRGERLHVTGTARWGTNREFGPNIGELDFTTDLNGYEAMWLEIEEGEERPYRIMLRFDDDGLQVDEENVAGRHGMNVSFMGRYVHVREALQGGRPASTDP